MRAHVIAGPCEIGNIFGYFGHTLPEGKFAVVIDGAYTNGGYGPSLAYKPGGFGSREAAEKDLAAAVADGFDD